MSIDLISKVTLRFSGSFTLIVLGLYYGCALV